MAAQIIVGIICSLIILFIIFSNRSSKKNTRPKIEQDGMSKILPKLSIESILKIEDSESSLYAKALEANFEGRKFLYVDNQTYERLNDKWHKYQKSQLDLAKTAELNNKGIEFEKSNLYEDAIKTYEECIKLRYPATHAYERLMILYRKIGAYEHEQRVINIAVEVFNEENKRRADIAKKLYPKYSDEIDLALETNEDVKTTDNKYVLSQYKVMKYFERYAKAQSLIDKRGHK